MPSLPSKLDIATALIARLNDDVHATGSNLLRVGAGSTPDALGNDLSKRYLEEIANVRLFYQYFSIGLRYEMDDPSEIGRSYQDRNFRRRWITYRKDQLEATAGDVPALFARGLAVNLFESRPLNYDSWLDGIFAKTEYQVPKEILNLGASITVKGVGGQENFYPIDTTQPLMHISARSADAEFGFFRRKLVLGADFLQAFTGTSQPGPFGTTFLTNRQVNQPDFYGDLNAGEFRGVRGWTSNRTQVSQILARRRYFPYRPCVLYGAQLFEFVYRTHVRLQELQLFPARSRRFLYQRIQQAPDFESARSHKDFTFTEITRTTHAVNFDDEVGYQPEANITAIPQFVIDLDAAASSSHDKYNTAGVAVDSTSLLPKLSDQGFYPFWEAYAEAEWDFDPANEENFVKFAIHRRSDIIAYNPASPSATDYRYATTIAGKVQYETRPNQSLLGILEHQWAYDASLTTPDKRRLNELLTLQYSFNPIVTFGGIFDYAFFYADGPLKIDKELFNGWNLPLWGDADLMHLPEFFVSLRMGGSHSLLVSYGAERGGINCTGGIVALSRRLKGCGFR